MPDTDLPTKLELFLKAYQIKSCCGSPTIHMAQTCFLKCEKCGTPLTRGFTLAQVKTIQDDLICP